MGMRIIVTLAVLFAYGLLRYLACLGISYYDYPARLLEGTIVTKFSVVGLGLQPYIIACLLTTLVLVVRGKAAKATVEQGLKPATLQRIILSGALLLAFIQSLAYARRALGPDHRDLFVVTVPQNTFILLTVATMVAGVFLVIWCGQFITQHGVGHGISLLFAVPIIDNVIRGLVRAFLRTDEAHGTLLFFALALAGLALVAWFFLTRSLRITVTKAGGEEGASSLDVPLSLAGILPAYFAVTILEFPTILSAIGPRQEGSWVRNLGDFLQDTSSVASWIAFGLLVAFFTPFVLQITGFNPQAWAQKLEKGRWTLTDIKPGTSAVDYLTNFGMRMGLQWAGFLLIMALLWSFIPYWLNVPGVRGTSRDFILLIGIVMAVWRSLASVPQQKEVYRHSDISEVLTAKAILAGQGVKAVVNEVEALGTLYPLPLGDIGSRTLMVGDASFEKAKVLVARYTAS